MRMAQILLQRTPSAQDTLAQMRLDARFDVGDDPLAQEPVPDLSAALGIRAPVALPTVPKVFLSNDCAFNCAYCTCRHSKDCRRYCMQPRELAALAVQGARAGGRGIFLTSAIYKSPDYTQELIIETLRAIRFQQEFHGYVHAKVMPGADPRLIQEAGRYANRLSVNIEVAQAAGYERVAKQKNRDNILRPMGDIASLIEAAGRERRTFASSQTTQLMAGSVGEDDRTIMTLTSAMYRKYRLKRVYYTAFTYEHQAAGYDLPYTATPAWRAKRLYQADRLLALYGFSPDDVTPEEQPFLQEDIDPKAAWALRNLHRFPVEVNTAEQEMLLRVPGLGVTFVRRILEARRTCRVTHAVLGQLGVSLRKSAFFITCGGVYRAPAALESQRLHRLLSDGPGVQLSMEDFARRGEGGYIC